MNIPMMGIVLVRRSLVIPSREGGEGEETSGFSFSLPLFYCGLAPEAL